MQQPNDTANEVATTAMETIQKVKDVGRDAIDKGYVGAREYASKGIDYANDVSETLAELAKQQPWLAVATAFAVGYLAAHVLRRLSS